VVALVAGHLDLDLVGRMIRSLVAVVVAGQPVALLGIVGMMVEWQLVVALGSSLVAGTHFELVVVVVEWLVEESVGRLVVAVGRSGMLGMIDIVGPLVVALVA
jgi:xanthosine utilization system XapX-like protein